MAILWSHREGGIFYQVRSAGSSLRLYTDGVLHTQFNSRRIITGSVWDLLWLPVFFRAEPSVKRVLLLGAGAGTVIRQIDRLFQPQQIIAVDNNAVHLQIAEKFFGVNSKIATLQLGEASNFIERYQGTKFDLIIDDLFIAEGGVAKRALCCDHHWIKQLTRHLDRDGLLCVNFPDRSEFSKAPFSLWIGPRQRFASGYELMSPNTENVIAALLPKTPDIESLRAHLKMTPIVSGWLKAGKLRFQIRLINGFKRKA